MHLRDLRGSLDVNKGVRLPRERAVESVGEL
jgi:hypothetical protein